MCKPGDAVAEDQVLADVMTDKATVEIPSPVAGKVLALGGEVGQMLAVGAELIRIEVEGAVAAATAAEAAAAPRAGAAARSGRTRRHRPPRRGAAAATGGRADPPADAADRPPRIARTPRRPADRLARACAAAPGSSASIWRT